MRTLPTLMLLLLTGAGISTFSFLVARSYAASYGRFTSVDPLAEKTPWLSPYAYCANNPVNCIDPTGCRIEGLGSRDIEFFIDDFKEMFCDAVFADFRELITRDGNNHKGKGIAPISSEALAAAFEGITLNEDQQALVDIVVNTINSKDVHKVEYIVEGKAMSRTSLDIYSKKLNSIGITAEMAANLQGGYLTFVKFLCGEASTIPTDFGSLTVMSENRSIYPTNRPATLGHEVIGHGRAYSLGYTDAQSQHTLPIQVENLILRVMGDTFQRDGTNHAPLRTLIPNFKSLPLFR